MKVTPLNTGICDEYSGTGPRCFNGMIAASSTVVLCYKVLLSRTCQKGFHKKQFFLINYFYFSKLFQFKVTLAITMTLCF